MVDRRHRARSGAGGSAGWTRCARLRDSRARLGRDLMVATRGSESGSRNGPRAGRCRSRSRARDPARARPARAPRGSARGCARRRPSSASCLDCNRRLAGSCKCENLASTRVVGASVRSEASGSSVGGDCSGLLARIRRLAALDRMIVALALVAIAPTIAAAAPPRSFTVDVEPAADWRAVALATALRADLVDDRLVTVTTGHSAELSVHLWLEGQ